jgi:hypothetical protein
MTMLSHKSAREYVSGYHAGIGDRFRIIGSWTGTENGLPVINVHVDLYEHGETTRISWDVFEEDDGMGGVCIRGEF